MRLERFSFLLGALPSRPWSAWCLLIRALSWALLLTLTGPGTTWAQQPVSTAPLYQVNAQHVQGRTWADFKPSAGTGLQLNVAPGTATIGGTVHTFSDATVLNLVPSATNYVFVDAGGTITSNTTGFTPGVIPIAEVVTGASAITTVTDRRALLTSGAGAARVFGGIRYADQFSGATASDKIDNAANHCSGANCLVVIPSNLGSGTATNPPDNVSFLDARRANLLNTASNPDSGYAKGLNLWTRYTSAPYSATNYAPLFLHSNAWAGGVNHDSGPKTNYMGLHVGLAGRTPGQHIATVSESRNYSAGDTLGLSTVSRTWGGVSASGDEGAEALSAQTLHGDSVFRATLTGATDNGGNWTLSYSSSADTTHAEETRGEGRWVLNTNPAKVYQTGYLTGVSYGSGTNTFTFTGTDFVSQFGAGTHTDLCLVPAADQGGGYLLGTGNGSQTVFSGTISGISASNPILAKSVAVVVGLPSDKAGVNFDGQDDGSGNFTGNNIAAGTINYTTGAITNLTFSTAPANGTKIYITYSDKTGDGNFKLAIPVDTIVDATHLTAKYSQSNAGSSAWLGTGYWSSGKNYAYRLYYCSRVASNQLDGVNGLGNSGSLTVVEGATNWEIGDTIEMPLLYTYHGNANNVIFTQNFQSPVRNVGLRIQNQSAKQFYNVHAINVQGPWSTIFNVWPDWTADYGINFQNDVYYALNFSQPSKTIAAKIRWSTTPGNVDVYADPSSGTLQLGGSNGVNVSGYAKFGTSPAGAGLLRLPASGNLTFRNNANSADINGLSLNANDFLKVGGHVELPGVVALTGSSASIEHGARGAANSPSYDFHSGATDVDYDVRLQASGGTGSSGGGLLTIESAGLALSGANPASTGALRLGNSQGIYFRNNANDGDIAGLVKDASDVVNLGGTAGARTTGGLTVDGAVNFSSATSTRSIKAGTSLPGSCQVGEYFFKTDATAGQNTYACTASDNWTLQGDGSGGGTNHNILSSTHTDTTTGTVARGDLITGQGSTPTWARLPKGSADQCLKMDGSGTDVVWGSCAGGGGGDNISVNSSSVTDADFDDTTPAAPSNAINVKWQKDSSSPNNISAYVPYAAPLAVATGNLTVQAGNGSQNGYISSTDWNTFNGKAATGTCTNQFARQLGSSSLTCASVAGTDFASQTANYVFAAPNGSSGTPTFRALVANDIPSLDAAKISSGIFGAARGGTNNAYFQVMGPSGAAKTFTFPNADATVLTTNAAVTAAQGGTGANNTATSGRYLKGDGTNFVTSNGSASGTGSCTNQFVTALNSDAAPTCSTATLSSAQFANQGTTSTVLHGNASGNPSWGAVVVADVTAVLKTRQFGFMVGADNASSALTDSDDATDIYVNRLGQGITITEVWCACDAGSPTIQLQRDDGSPTNMLSSNLTCSSGAGANTSSFSGTENQIANGDRVDFLIVSAGGMAKRITVYVKYTLD